MRGVVTIVFLLTVFLVSCATDREDKILYLCEDSETVLLTHEASLGCPVYEPRAELITVRDGATWADVEWAVGLKLAERPSPAQQRAQERAEEVRTDPCSWPDLSLQRHITVGVEADEDVKKWERLSRVVPDKDLCEKYRVKRETPTF